MSPARGVVPPLSAPVFVTVMSGAWVAVAVTRVFDGALTAGPVGGVPVERPVFVTDPASTSACVMR